MSSHQLRKGAALPLQSLPRDEVDSSVLLLGSFTSSEVPCTPKRTHGYTKNWPRRGSDLLLLAGAQLHAWLPRNLGIHVMPTA